MIAKAGVVFVSFFLLLATWGGEVAGQNRPDGELTEDSVAYLYGEYAVRLAGATAPLDR